MGVPDLAGPAHLLNPFRRPPFAKVDTEAERALAAQADIHSIPTLMAFRDQMDDVRAKLKAKAQAS